jgi:hypothetical protein
MLWRALGLSLLVVVFFGCGGGDDDDGASGATGYRTCDRRAQTHTCIEMTGSPQNVANQEDGCLEADGSWSTSACPETNELIGCCEYTFGNRFRECFYAGAATADPEATCLDNDVFDDGVWTPASR